MASSVSDSAEHTPIQTLLGKRWILGDDDSAFAKQRRGRIENIADDPPINVTIDRWMTAKIAIRGGSSNEGVQTKGCVRIRTQSPKMGGFPESEGPNDELDVATTAQGRVHLHWINQRGITC